MLRITPRFQPCYLSTVTVTGDRMRTVVWVPAGSDAALRSPAAVAAAPAPAPVAPPMTAPLAPPRIAPRIAPPTAPPPIFAALDGASPSRVIVSVLIGPRVPPARAGG